MDGDGGEKKNLVKNKKKKNRGGWLGCFVGVLGCVVLVGFLWGGGGVVWEKQDCSKRKDH